jgi:hypothetical protein
MDWRSQLCAELGLGGGEDRLADAERANIAKGRSFEQIFDGATNVRSLPWRLPDAKCEITYVDGDPNPWCRCTATMPASMEAVLEAILDFEGPAVQYHERVAFRALDRPSVHNAILSFKVRIVPMMPPFEWSLSATWAASMTEGGEKEYTIVFLPASTARTSDAQAAATLQLMVLRPGDHAGECRFTYIFQLNFGMHMAALERLLPKARITVLRNHRELVACMQRHHRATFWRSQLHAELALGGAEDRLTDAERVSIAKGRSFEAIFKNTAKVKPLPWRLPGAQCDIAYADGDPNPWCRCIVTIPAAVEAVLEGLWEIDNDATRYHELVELRVLERPSAHRVNWVFRFRAVPVLPAFESRLEGTWAQSTAGGKKEFVIVFLPATAAAAEAERIVAWIDDSEHDVLQREEMIAEMESASSLEYSTMDDDEVIQRGMAMFTLFERSSLGVKKHAAALVYSETKLDRETHLLLGRAAAIIRTAPQEIVAYTLSYCSSRIGQSLAAADPNTLRCESLATVHARHNIGFLRLTLPGISDRTFLYSTVAKRVAEHPPTYVMVVVPIPCHAKIGPKDEAGAVRAEVYRSFKLTEVEPGVTKLDYCCSLDLKGRVPQIVTNTVALPQQLNGV